jgi:hypothetical protein
VHPYVPHARSYDPAANENSTHRAERATENRFEAKIWFRAHREILGKKFYSPNLNPT